MDKETAYNIALQYVKYLKQNKYDIEKVILFGSYSKGNFNNDSDIDIAIVFRKLDDKFNMQVKLIMLTTQFDTRIEPHPFDKDDFTTNNPFANEIIKHGIEIS